MTLYVLIYHETTQLSIYCLVEFILHYAKYVESRQNRFS